MEIPNIVSLIIGGYAAIVATGALVWNILRERRKIRLKVDAIGKFKSNTDTGEPITEERVDIIIINDSNKPITIKRVGINYGSWNDEYDELDNNLCQKRLKLKQDLLPGDSQIWRIPMNDIKGVNRAKPAQYVYVEDGRYHRHRMKIPRDIFEKYLGNGRRPDLIH